MNDSIRTIIISAPQGILPFTADEVTALGYPVLWKGESALGTRGTWRDTLRLNLWLRTAHHVFYQIDEFGCSDLAMLYRKVHSLPWERIIQATGFVSVTASVDHPGIRDHRIVNVKCKDAIVDRIAETKRQRPDSGSQRDRTVVAVFWKNRRCSISIDTSGEPLTRRGYRKIPLNAPMQESLAAAVVMASRFGGNEYFINPMCGSGTLAIEAAMLAACKAPGLTRTNYGFMHTLFYRKNEWRELVGDAQRTIRTSALRIIASDNDVDAISAAQQNATAADVADTIEFSTGEFAATRIPEGNGVVVFNPEYGMRLGEERQLVETYRAIGTFMKQQCGGYRGYVFTGNTKLAGNVGLKSGRKIRFFNGKIECRLYEYELFSKRKS